MTVSFAFCSLFFGLLYPTAKSIEAVETADGHDDAQVCSPSAYHHLLLGCFTKQTLMPDRLLAVAHVLDHLHATAYHRDSAMASPEVVRVPARLLCSSHHEVHFLSPLSVVVVTPLMLLQPNLIWSDDDT